MISIKTVVLGDIYTNTYVIKDECTGDLAVIDPAIKSEALLKAIDEWGGRLKYILLTHGHFDHIGGVSALKNRYGSLVCASEDEIGFIKDSSLNGCDIHNITVESFSVDKALCDNDEFYLGKTKIKFITTPGHTAGSGCYIAQDNIFSGDTLFFESIGRTNFPTSNHRDMLKSLEKLTGIEGDYTVYPGHYIATTLEHERYYNPYMR